MKILNLYSGLGGNRQLWGNHDVVAVEINREIADIYQDLYPNDTVIVSDAHEYLQENFKDFEFIWSSPPCQSHSQIRFNLGVKNRSTKPIYADMRLYQEVLFLQYYFKGNWVVENTISYYEPLIRPQKVGMHYFWSNFHITSFEVENREHRAGTVKTLEELKGISIKNYDIINKRQLLRNCCEPDLALHVFKCGSNKKQITLLDIDNKEVE